MNEVTLRWARLVLGWVTVFMWPSQVYRALIGWVKGGNVTSAGWQVTLCDPVWHVSSRSGEVKTHRCDIRNTNIFWGGDTAQTPLPFGSRPPVPLSNRLDTDTLPHKILDLRLKYCWVVMVHDGFSGYLGLPVLAVYIDFWSCVLRADHMTVSPAI